MKVIPSDAGGVLRRRVGSTLRAAILRSGSFYSHDAVETLTAVDLTRRRFLPAIGTGDSSGNRIHVDGAATAVVSAVKWPALAGGHTFNVCDAEPLTARALLTRVAERRGATPPHSIPAIVAERLLGVDTARLVPAPVRCRDNCVKSSLGFRLELGTYRGGLAIVVARPQAAPSSSRP